MLCRFSACLVLLPAALLCGCSKPKAVIKGMVTADSQEVSAGGLVFSPKASGEDWALAASFLRIVTAKQFIR